MIEPNSAIVLRPHSRRFRAGIRLLAGVICASLALAQTARAQTKISIGYSPFIDALTAFAAKDKGIFAKHGLDAELVAVPLNSNMPAAVLSGAVNLGAMSTTVFLQAVDAGVKLQIVQNISMLPNKDAVIATPGGIVSDAVPRSIGRLTDAADPQRCSIRWRQKP